MRNCSVETNFFFFANELIKRLIEAGLLHTPAHIKHQLQKNVSLESCHFVTKVITLCSPNFPAHFLSWIGTVAKDTLLLVHVNNPAHKTRVL